MKDVVCTFKAWFICIVLPLLPIYYATYVMLDGNIKPWSNAWYAFSLIGGWLWCWNTTERS